MQASLLDN